MQCLARDPRQAPERFLAPISSICTTALARTKGALLDCFTPKECANYFRNAGYASA